MLTSRVCILRLKSLNMHFDKLVLLYTVKTTTELKDDRYGKRMKKSMSCEIAGLLLNLDLAFLEDEIFANDTSPDIVYILDDRFKVGCSIVGAGNENVIRLAITCRGMKRFDLDKPEETLVRF